MTPLTGMYFAYVFVLIGFIFQRKAYNAKCRECESLWKILKAHSMVQDRLIEWRKECK